ncbi:MAG: hypothetical protein INQ03_04875 [Candidatus Heimdallarchaeota archaeon]|nr:hypothetical protein [Candidatus Heimdallarchaeota archaeon]
MLDGLGQSSNCKFGLSSLDVTLNGGLNRGATYIIEQTIGSDADPVILSFLANGLQSMDYTFLLSTEQTTDYYKKIFQGFGRNWDMEISTGRLRFIDAFSGSFQTGLSSSMFMDAADNQGVINIPDITNAREVNEGIRQSLLHVKKGFNVGIRGAILNFSSIIHTFGDNSQVFTFLQSRRAMDKLENSTTILALNADAHDPVLVRGLEHMVDGILSVTQIGNTEYGDPLNEIEVIHMKSRVELNGRKVRYSFQNGRLVDMD